MGFITEPAKQKERKKGKKMTKKNRPDDLRNTSTLTDC